MPEWLLDLLNPTGAIGTLINTVASFIPNPAEKAKAQLAMQQAILTAAITADQQQRDINKVEAASSSMFVAGGRPAAIWLCVFTLAYTWIIAPITTWIIIVAGAVHVPALPTLNDAEAQTLLYTLLGISAVRTVDKIVPGGTTKAIQGIFKKK